MKDLILTIDFKTAFQLAGCFAAVVTTSCFCAIVHDAIVGEPNER